MRMILGTSIAAPPCTFFLRPVCGEEDTMKYRWAILAASAAILPACSETLPTEPGASADIVATADADDPFANLLGSVEFVVEELVKLPSQDQSARGHGDVGFTKLTRSAYSFSFTAQRDDDLTKLDADADGEFEYWTTDLKGTQLRLHADVTCLWVTGNTAVIGGVIRHSDSKLKAFQPGSAVMFQAEDWGEEGQSNPFDALSDLVPMVDSKLSCLKVKFVKGFLIESGNIQIPWVTKK